MRGVIMKNKNWFWGFFFLLAAVFVIASQTELFGEIGYFSILITILLMALIIHSIFKLEFFGIFVPIAFLYSIYWEPLGLMDISWLILIMSSVLTSIGFSILFRKNPINKSKSFGGSQHFSQSSESIDDNNPYTKVSFGASSKYLHSDCLKSGQFIVSFGALEVFFDQAKLSPDGAEIFLDCSFGAIKLYIPKTWRVLDSLQATLGGVENKNQSGIPDENAPCLTLSGNVQLGGIEIQYI